MLLCPYHDPPRIEMCMAPCQKRAAAVRNTGSYLGVPEDTPSGTYDEVVVKIKKRSSPERPTVYVDDIGVSTWAELFRRLSERKVRRFK